MTSEGSAEPAAPSGSASGADAERRATIATEVARGAAERLAFFSDAVVAIAITLLAIELPVPSGATDQELLHSLREESLAYITFLVSFVAIASHWAAHHRVFRWVGRADRGLVTLNLGWLLLIVLTPFLTEVLREGGRLSWVRFGLYALAQALLLFLLAVIIARLARRGMFIEGTPRSLAHRGWVGAALSGSGFLVSIPFFPLLHVWAVAIWVAVPLVLNRTAVRMGWMPPHSDED